ncbi:MAG: phosphoglycerate dehydrogenase [Clostridia bacterium]
MNKSALLTLPEAWKDSLGKAVGMLEDRGIHVDRVWSDTGLPKEKLIGLLQGKQAHMMSLDVLDRDVIERCPDLKVIAKHGIGLDNIDIAAATTRKIPVCNTPGSNCHAVADLTLGLLLCACRKIGEADALVRQGRLIQIMGTELHAKAIGVVGFGAIGRQVALRAKGFGMRVLAYDKFMDHTFCQANDVAPAEFDEILRTCDFITLHLPLTKETKGLIGPDALARMKKGAVLINVSRGGVVDEDACAQALMDGHLAAAGFDVFSKEPPDIADKLFKAPNVVLTTHMAGCTRESIARSAEMAAQNIIDILDGKRLPNVVNQEIY